MSHLDEGTVLAARDGAPVDRAAELHLEDCHACGTLVEDARGRSEAIEKALATIDDPVDTEAAKAAVRARLDRIRKAAQPRWRTRHLGRAAALLLVAAGAASALPGSPVRNWWARPPASPTSTESGAPVTTQAATPGGIAVDVPEGRMEVVIRNPGSGSVIEVVWTDEATARVTAPAGSGFSYGEGRVEVDAELGAIRIELPRDVESSLQVGGTTYLQRTTEGLDVSGPILDASDELLRFRVPGA